MNSATTRFHVTPAIEHVAGPTTYYDPTNLTSNTLYRFNIPIQAILPKAGRQEWLLSTVEESATGVTYRRYRGSTHVRPRDIGLGNALRPSLYDRLSLDKHPDETLKAATAGLVTSMTEPNGAVTNYASKAGFGFVDAAPLAAA